MFGVQEWACCCKSIVPFLVTRSTRAPISHADMWLTQCIVSSFISIFREPAQNTCLKRIGMGVFL